MIIIIITIIEKINDKTLVLSRTFVFFRSQTCIKRSPEWRGDRLVQVDRLIQVPWNRVVIKKMKNKFKKIFYPVVDLFMNKSMGSCCHIVLVTLVWRIWYWIN